MNQEKLKWSMSVRNEGHSQVGDIRLYGPVEEKEYFWDENESITPKKFNEDLKALEHCDSICVHLNTTGGDVYSALTICNTLKNLKQKVTVIVDGIAASAGSVIMCGGDEVKVSESSIVMIHGVKLGVMDYLDTDDLQKLLTSAQAIEKSAANVYAAKTGKSQEELLQAMKDETWLIGQEIIDFGFANGFIEAPAKTEVEVENRGGKAFMTINHLEMDLSHCKNLPVSIRMALDKEEKKKCSLEETSDQKDEEKENTEKQEDKDEKEEGEDDDMDEKKLEQARNEGIKMERQRFKEINEVAAFITDSELVSQAMNGEMNADTLARKALLKGAIKGATPQNTFMKALEEDMKESGMDGVGQAMPSHESGSLSEAQILGASMAESFKTLYGGK